ncbi:MAG TPA: DUF4142 domain-containing protein [Azospirillaceae bacterium]|nr:DUF4142 domain-containing protein [Azospirillaceae bacterium]
MNLMLAKLIALAAVMPFLAAEGFAQDNIRPPSTAHLPPPVVGAEGPLAFNRMFVEQALTAGQTQMEAARIAAEKAENPQLRQLAGKITQDFQLLNQSLTQLAQGKQITPALSGGQAAAGSPVQRLDSLSGSSFDQEYLRLASTGHLDLLRIYQTEAAETQDLELRTFSADRLLVIKQNFDQLRPLAQEAGIPLEYEGNPPQYR